MTRFRVFVFSAFVVSLLVTWRYTTLHAQPPAAEASKPTADVKYQIVRYGRNSAVKIDIQSGESWQLDRDGEAGGLVWVPIRTLKTDMEIEVWKARKKELREERRGEIRGGGFGGEESIPGGADPFGGGGEF